MILNFQEPLGGAHTDPAWTSQQIKLMVTKAMEVYLVLQVAYSGKN